MKQKYVIWGLAGAAFLVTLGISAWREGLWSPDEPSAPASGVAASHSLPMPEHPFQAAVNTPAPVSSAATVSPPTAVLPPKASMPPPVTASPPTQPGDGNAASAVTNAGPLSVDPPHEQSQDDYVQRAKLMQEIAERARAR